MVIMCLDDCIGMLTLSLKCRLLITCAYSFDLYQARQDVGPDMGPNCLTL